MKDLLKKWLNGGVTWSEEKKLRQAAEQDHFLAEAMEGYDAFPITDHAAKIKQLKGRFGSAKKEEKGLVFSLSRIAAAAAIIGVIGTFFWVQRAIEDPTAISQSIEEIEAPTPSQNTKEAIVLNETTANEPTSNKIEATNNNSLPKPIIQQTTNPNPTTEQAAISDAYNTTATPLAETTLPPSEVAFNTTLSDKNITETTDIVEPSIIAAAPENKTTIEKYSPPESAADIAYDAPVAPIQEEKSSSTKRRSAKHREAAKIDNINYYVGKVQNEDGQPMHAAKIEGMNTPFSTLSEINGEFTLETDIPLTTIAVSKDGFHTRKIAISQYSDFLNVGLNKKSAELPATAADLEAVILSPAPIAGFKDFFTYLEANQIYPAAAKAKGIERAVEVRFYIDKEGTPTQLKVTNPDSYGFDKEAIRLLKKGPKWMPVNSHARYYVPFELE